MAFLSVNPRDVLVPMDPYMKSGYDENEKKINEKYGMWVYIGNVRHPDIKPIGCFTQVQDLVDFFYYADTSDGSHLYMRRKVLQAIYDQQCVHGYTITLDPLIKADSQTSK